MWCEHLTKHYTIHCTTRFSDVFTHVVKSSSTLDNFQKCGLPEKPHKNRKNKKQADKVDNKSEVPGISLSLKELFIVNLFRYFSSHFVMLWTTSQNVIHRENFDGSRLEKHDVMNQWTSVRV